MDLNPIYLNEMGYALGEKRQSLEESFEHGETFSEVSLLRDSGFVYHHKCSDHQTAYDLARSALDNLITDHNKSLKSVSGILYATCLSCNGNLGQTSEFESTRDVKYLMDFPASHLQAEFEMERAFVMGLNQTACTSLLGALRVAKALLSTDSSLNEILCLTADRFPNGAAYEQTYNLISDGAAACVVSREKQGYRIIDCHHISNGAMARANDDETAGFYFSYSNRVVNELLDRNKLQLSDISWIVPQNTNIKAWEVLSSIMRFDYSRVLVPTREDIGHCISGDNIINLKTVSEKNIIQSGDLVLLPMAGFGLNWSCVLLEKV